MGAPAKYSYDVPPLNAYRDLACQTADPELFFPGKGGDPAPAVALCSMCPIKVECATWAIKTDQKYGIWGGTTGEQRRAIRRTNAQRHRKAYAS